LVSQACASFRDSLILVLVLNEEPDHSTLTNYIVPPLKNQLAGIMRSASRTPLRLPLVAYGPVGDVAATATNAVKALWGVFDIATYVQQPGFAARVTY
jgi:hypothetical protein